MRTFLMIYLPGFLTGAAVMLTILLLTGWRP